MYTTVRFILQFARSFYKKSKILVYTVIIYILTNQTIQLIARDLIYIYIPIYKIFIHKLEVI